PARAEDRAVSRREAGGDPRGRREAGGAPRGRREAGGAPRGRRPTWSDLRAEHLQARAEAGHSPVTVELCERALAEFEAVCHDRGADRPDQVQPADVAAYRQDLLWRPGHGGRFLSPSTVAQRLTMVRTFFRWGVSRRHLLVDPTASLVLRATPPPPGRALSLGDADALPPAPDPWTP